MPTSKTPLEIVFGAMTFGRAGEEQVRTSSLDDCAAILDTFESYGHSEIDTSRFYGGGSSEEYLASLDWKSRGLTMDTKFFPNVRGIYGRPVTHLVPDDMRAGLEASLSALGTESVDVWYLHAPDRSVPIAETLACVNELYRAGKFKRWGVSNFMAWEVAQICQICTANSYPLPSIYQGMYNALHRTIESELLPCLRAYNMSFYAFNPLAGGWLTDRYTRSTTTLEPGSRFDTATLQGKMYRLRFWNDEFFSALELLREKKGGLRESEVALRWMVHHSMLSAERGDKVIVGASSKEQLEMNLGDFEKGPLGEEVLAALDKGWEGCRGVTGKYFH
ncbi:NADP-dependent oxidoreductase domain-containing protein [Phaeosphaeria sp. MPI-PUGE-AT-0046c]|nr:NADP-dependent oxidoreductase domain-containing protein [Phaeosphaeria sp. MPI-PUGE-AT-0046c]